MKLALIDGYNLAFRAFYGMPELTRKDGFPTGALHGWVRSLWWVDDHLKPDRLVVFFDLGGAARQTALHADYKANRKETPPALAQQFPYIREWTRAMGYGGVESQGVEADDLIASCAVQRAEAGDTVWIVSADKDLAQLIRPGVSQWLPPPTANPKLGWRELDAAGVEKKFGVKPSQIADYLALIGDTSDNIPGLAGVGPKTAAKWLNQYKNLAGILANCGDLQPKRFQALVHAGRSDLLRNLEMTRLHTNLDVSSVDSTPAPDPEAVILLLEQMEMMASAKAARERFKRF
jgi:DNA polymerase I